MLDQTPTRASRVRLPSNAKLIGSPICPFVARARIVAHELGIDLPISFIDLFEKPRWFVENSPTGTVPALRWENEFIFESAVISEFLNEISPGDLHPAEPVARALNRSWIEFAGSILRQQYFMMTASSAEDSSRNRAGLITALERLERIVTPGPFFNGPSFAIVDAAYAPVFVRCRWMAEHHGVDVLAALPRLQEWGAAIVERSSVRAVHDDGHRGLLVEHLAIRGSIFA